MGAEEHAVVIAGGGPTGMMLVAELALAGVDAVIVERREARWGLALWQKRFEEILAGSVAELDVPTRGGKAGTCGWC